jgi:hypothetical protein
MGQLQELRTYNTFDYSQEVLKEGLEKHNKIFLKGILQKANTLNQNGRIYSREVLEREIRNYQKFIVENRALGELDHPDSCVPTGSEIYTIDGWKKIEDVIEGEMVLTINPETETVTFQPVKQTIDQEYSGDLVHIQNNKSMDFLFSPNHRVMMWDRNNKTFFASAKDILDGNVKQLSKCAMKFSSKGTCMTHTSKSMSFDSRFTRITAEKYTGHIHCVVTKNQTWLLRQNGKVCWTGNSVVALKNVSHIIREAHFEGDNVVGTLEVLDKVPSGAILKGLVESEVKLGISSRGVGSTKKDGDYDVVQSDFQLIAFDMVSDPSTPEAFMLPEGRSRTLSQKDLREIFNRSDRIDRILNEILYNK